MLIIADKECVKKTFADNGDTALLVGGKKGHRRFVIADPSVHSKGWWAEDLYRSSERIVSRICYRTRYPLA